MWNAQCTLVLVACLGVAHGFVVQAAPRSAARRAARPVAQALGDGVKPDLMSVEESQLAGPAVDPETGQEVDNDFVLWYKAEKARDAYEKENPVNPLDGLAAKIKNAAVPLAIVGTGFYIIPIVRGLTAGFQSGEGIGGVIGSVLGEIASPTGEN